MIKMVIKRNGGKEPFSADKINGWGEWASSKLAPEVNWSEVVLLHPGHGSIEQLT